MARNISLKALVKNIRESDIVFPKKGKETPLDAKIQIPGFGVMTRKQLRDSIRRYIFEVNKYAKVSNFNSVYTTLYDRKILKTFLETEKVHSGGKHK